MSQVAVLVRSFRVLGCRRRSPISSFGFFRGFSVCSCWPLFVHLIFLDDRPFLPGVSPPPLSPAPLTPCLLSLLGSVLALALRCPRPLIPCFARCTTVPFSLENLVPPRCLASPSSIVPAMTCTCNVVHPPCSLTTCPPLCTRWFLHLGSLPGFFAAMIPAPPCPSPGY